MVLFFVGILPALRNIRARVASGGGTPRVAYINDKATAPTAITDASISEFISLRNDLATVEIQLFRGKTRALPPAYHRETSLGLEVLAGAGNSMTPSDGFVSGGMPVGSDSFVVNRMRKLPTELDRPTVGRHIAATEDA